LLKRVYTLLVSTNLRPDPLGLGSSLHWCSNQFSHASRFVIAIGAKFLDFLGNFYICEPILLYATLFSSYELARAFWSGGWAILRQVAFIVELLPGATANGYFLSICEPYILSFGRRIGDLATGRWAISLGWVITREKFSDAIAVFHGASSRTSFGSPVSYLWVLLYYFSPGYNPPWAPPIGGFYIKRSSFKCAPTKYWTRQVFTDCTQSQDPVFWLDFRIFEV